MLLPHHLGHFGLHHSAGLTDKGPRQEHGRPRRCLPLNPPQATPSVGPAQGHRPCFAVEDPAGPSEAKDGGRAITHASRDEGSLGPSSVQAEGSWPPRPWQSRRAHPGREGTALWSREGIQGGDLVTWETEDLRDQTGDGAVTQGSGTAGSHHSQLCTRRTRRKCCSQSLGPWSPVGAGATTLASLFLLSRVLGAPVG